MSLLKIINYGHPLLRERAAEVTEMNDAMLDIIEGMAVTMYENGGVGLAANQVGLLKRVFVVDGAIIDDEDFADEDEDEDGVDGDQESDDEEGEEADEDDADYFDDLLVFINPEIIEESAEDGPYDEGCLSIPDVRGEVYRPLRVKVRAMDEHLEPFEVEAEGLLARVIQHELDHLNGVLFVDHLPLMKRTLLAGDLNRLKKASLEELPSLEGVEYPIVLAQDVDAEAEV
ncbi:peptide deformylase [candidate division BRC1 bacterium HGW-BRC1-1]|nr:MAG: peptide deformylase [candidate division BRC1 bacterium HGW-BRC1-1]